jgi:hypothetical protein
VTGIYFVAFHLVSGCELFGHDIEALTLVSNFFVSMVWLEAYVMIVAGPLMAMWYAWITIEEIVVLNAAIHHRAEVHWKL